jgi:hypothetical protein
MCRSRRPSVTFSLKDPAWRAAFFSGLVWPGAGQLLNRQIVKGLAFSLATLAIVAALLVRIVQWVWDGMLDDPARLDPFRAFTLAHEHAAELVLALLALGGVWLLSVWDGWRSAPRPPAAGDRRS